MLAPPLRPIFFMLRLAFPFSVTVSVTGTMAVTGAAMVTVAVSVANLAISAFPLMFFFFFPVSPVFYRTVL